MQLSISVPSDSTVLPSLPGTPADVPSAMADGTDQPPSGFAQLLAGLGGSATQPSAAASTGGAPTGVGQSVPAAQAGIRSSSLSLLFGALSGLVGAPQSAATATDGGATAVTASPDTPVAIEPGDDVAIGTSTAKNVTAGATKVAPDDPNLEALVCAMVAPTVSTNVPAPTPEGAPAANGDISQAPGGPYCAGGLHDPAQVVRGAKCLQGDTNSVLGTPKGAAATADEVVETATACPVSVYAPASFQPKAQQVGPGVDLPQSPLAVPSETVAGTDRPPAEGAIALPTAVASKSGAQLPILDPAGTTTANPGGASTLPMANGMPSSAKPVALRARISALERDDVSAEKFAGIAERVGARDRGGIRAAAKSFLGSSEKELTKSSPALGIGVAGSDATMPAGSTLARSNTSEPAAILNVASAADARADVSALPQPVALTSTAHRAVEAVLDVTERFSARDQHAVNLQFSVAGADLKVRVELRAGEVHTTFRTDSAELRAALSTEWQSVSAQANPDRSTRLAPPVFTSNDASNNSFTGDSASRQREQQQQPRVTPESFAALSMPKRSGTTDFTATAPSVTRTASASSVHLHTLA